MKWMYTLYCRAFQGVFNIGARFLKWRRSELISGAKSSEKVAEILKREMSKKPLIVTGPNVGRLLLPEIINKLESNRISYKIYDEVESDPTDKTCMKIRDTYREAGCDSFIAVGGGSPMDAAKGALALLVKPNKSIEQLKGILKIRRKTPLFIAIPTTAGTGSETTIAAVITNSDTHRKAAIMDLNLVPDYAILDPCLTLALPPHVTAITGMDALTHAVEAYICRSYNTRESLQFAREAVKDIFENLEIAYKDGSNVEAREKTLIASYKAGFAFTRAGVGNVHAIAHTVGGLYGTAHGLANAVILPIVLEDYGESAWRKLAELGRVVGVAGNGEKEVAEKFVCEIREMNRRMDIPDKLEFIRDEDIETMTQWALAEANPLYPVPVVYDRERCRKVINKIRGN